MIKEVLNLLEKPSYRNLFSLKDPTEEDLIEIESEDEIKPKQKNDDNFLFYQEHIVS